MSVNVVTSVTAMVSPILDDLGLELYDMEFSGGVLKVTIDTPAGQESGVDIDQISRVNRLLGRELDHNDVVPGRYTLEVSSPGLERNLRTPHHFQREVGKDVSIRLVAEHEGQRRFAGALVAATDATATVRVTDTAQSVEIPLSLIEKAKTVFVWESQPKPNSKEARAAKRSTSQKSVPSDQQTSDHQEVSAQ
ncbi:MAG: ribosome maturation factor RimP [Actinomycetota bacterium]